MSHPKRLRIGLVGSAAVIVAVLFFVRFRNAPEAEAHAAVADVPRLDGKWIRYSSQFAERCKIVFAECELGSLSPIVSVTGTVGFDPQRTAAIGSRISGRVRKVHKFEGDHVAAGEVLLELESAEVGQAQSAVVSARALAVAAIANAKRESALAEEHITSQRDAELARANESSAKADLRAAEQKLRAFGGSEGGEPGILLLRSPIEGKVVNLSVSRGQTVEPSFTAMRIADIHHVWIELAVFERELGQVRRGDDVELTPQTGEPKVVRGTVAHVGDVIDVDTRSAAVRVAVDNSDESLRPGQSVLAKIHTARTTTPAPLVRLESTTIIDGKPTVFVAHDLTSVEPRTVELGARDGRNILVTSGLAPGERVVVSGTFALKAEVFR